MSPAPELKATLTLPQTAFPMKANLPQNEPLRLARWTELRLYDELRKAGQGRPVYLLHDGPPYANGPIHLGHALNKGLKDFVVKSKTMAGFDAPYVPGYDCHGLPIEIKVDEQLGRKKLEMPVPAVLDACRAYAQKYIDLQTSQFQRIGCFGRWDNPYQTMSRDYEARTLEAFYGFLEKGFVYRGLKPVYWCIHDRTALAEAEIEYEQHTSPSIYVRYAAHLRRQTAIDARARRPRGLHHHLDHHSLDPPRVDGRRLPSRLRIRCPEATAVRTRSTSSPQNSHRRRSQRASSADATEIARFKGSAARPRHLQASLPRAQHPRRPRHLCHRRHRHRRSPHRALAWRRRLLHRPALRPRSHLPRRCRRPSPRRSNPHGPTPSRPPSRARRSGPPTPSSSTCSKTSGALLGPRRPRALIPALLALPQPRHLPRHRAVVHLARNPDKTRRRSKTISRKLAIEEIDKVIWDPAWGKERITNMIATRPDWCISRQRIWGVPIAVFLCESCNQPILDAALNRKIIDLFDREGAEAWHTTRYRVAACQQDAKCAQCGGQCPSQRKPTSSTSGSTPA